MDLVLTRKTYKPFGIFGELSDGYDEFIAVTLERPYDMKPKLPSGRYLCKRGSHKLNNHESWFDTFEITGVKGHTGILFHTGNTANDSEGCVLLGDYIGTMSILDSRPAFARFMKIQEGLNFFYLEVK